MASSSIDLVKGSMKDSAHRRLGRGVNLQNVERDDAVSN